MSTTLPARPNGSGHLLCPVRTDVLVIATLFRLISVFLFSAIAVNQEQQLARERSLETAQGDMQRRYHISDEAHPLQAGLDAAAGISDQVA